MHQPPSGGAESPPDVFNSDEEAVLGLDLSRGREDPAAN